LIKHQIILSHVFEQTSKGGDKVNYNALKQLRVKKKISLQEMADVLGLQTAGGYSRIESGENKLKAEHLPLIADRFGMDLNELMKVLFFDSKLDVCSSGQSAAKEVV
jgi:transcriptional regulator with XRE-family HTH domain